MRDVSLVLMQALDEGMDRYRQVWTICIHKQLLAVSNRTNVRNVGPVEASLSVEFPKPSLTFKARSQSAKLWSPTLGRGVPWQQKVCSLRKCKITNHWRVHWRDALGDAVTSVKLYAAQGFNASSVQRRLANWGWKIRDEPLSPRARDRALKCRSRKKSQHKSTKVESTLVNKIPWFSKIPWSKSLSLLSDMHIVSCPGSLSFQNKLYKYNTIIQPS